MRFPSARRLSDLRSPTALGWRSWLLVTGAVAMVLTSGAFGGCSRTGLLPGDLTTSVEEPEVLTCPGLEIDSVRLGEVEQMDLLFVIDNSSSMTDKQELLRDAIPTLVRRLANPLCVSQEDGKEEHVPPDPYAACPDGFRREFEPIADIHVGVISSSLGAHGGDVCTGDGSFGEQANDRAHLIATRPRGQAIPTYQDSGFLAWDPGGERTPAGEFDVARLEQNFQDMVLAVGDRGCGFESTLESWYRFLIDPEPPASVEVERGQSVERGVDQALLQQRASFLRPDSLVVIVTLSDENDCSISDSGRGWLAASLRQTMPRGSAACQDAPNSPCCRPCALSESNPPPGCEPLSMDPECAKGGSLAIAEDPINLRCFDQKRRFGLDFLYPTARYAVGLRSRTLCPDSVYQDADCTCRAAKESAAQRGAPEPPCTEEQTGKSVSNPLFSNLSGGVAFERDASQVFVASIIGVPWQDIATPETLDDPNRLEYLRPNELGREIPGLGYSRWDLILGDLELGVPPRDPFMVESVSPRSGTNPITGEPIVDVTSQDPLANSINGHERLLETGSDLQYACIFRLETPRECDDPSEPCDCSTQDAYSTNPLCQPPGGGSGGNIQYFAKAYPSLRHIDLLEQHGNNSVVASICPKPVEGGRTDVGFGYRPAVSGLIKRLRCASIDADFVTDPASDEYGQISCRLITVQSPTQAECDCGAQRLQAPDPDTDLAVRAELQARGRCRNDNSGDCDAFCVCEVPQAQGRALRACHNELSPRPIDPSTGLPVDGWCYVDPDRGFGDPELVADCPVGNQRNLRLLGAAVPSGGEQLFVVCGTSCDEP